MAQLAARNAFGESVATTKRSTDYVCSRIEIEPATNGGYSVKKYYRPASEKPRKGDSCCGPAWVEPDTYAFSSEKELVTFLKTAFGGKKG
jgi:hypothetical protein